MSRVVITGVSCLTPAGIGLEPFRSAVAAGLPLGAAREEPGRRQRPRPLRVAKMPAFDREKFLPARKLRRMGELSQIWTLVCLLARADAGLDRDEATGPSPERRGTFLGTGFGCTDTTWDYLAGMFQDGMAAANPFLFSESVANAPAGHSAIELDARGTCVTLTSGDASAAAALAMAALALEQERLDLAYCGGVELMTVPLLRALAAVGGPSFLGEGAACLVLETLHSATQRGARILAEVAGWGMASDSSATPSSWTTHPEALKEVMARALDSASRLDEGRPIKLGKVLLHACGCPASDAAERDAAEAVCPGVPRISLTPIFGTHAAAGGLALVAGALEAEPAGQVLVNAHAWGGSAYSLVLRRFSG